MVENTIFETGILCKAYSTITAYWLRYITSKKLSAGWLEGDAIKPRDCAVMQA